MINEFRVPPYSKWTDFPIFVPDINCGYVIRCYDGDTITIVSNPYGEVCRFTLRISGLDTPELKGSTVLEKTAAEIVRDELKKMISNKFVRIKIHGNDKYGRLLVDIWVDGYSDSINQWLLDNKYALPYDGGKKSIFQDEFLMTIIRKNYNIVVKNQSKKDVNDSSDASRSSDNSL
jgi:endonuclease YncB( thermonuclease family)